MRREKGQVAAFVTVFAVVLVGAAGLLVDLGNVYLYRARARNAADAIALAAASDLPNAATATATAYAYAQQNGVQNSELEVTTPYQGDPNKIQSLVTKNVKHYFMAIFGLKSTNVVGRAVAGMVNSGEEIEDKPIPIAVPDSAIPGSCVLWGPNNQCNDTPPSGGGSLGAQYKGLVDLRTCDEAAEATPQDCDPFTPATDYGNKPNNISHWVSEGCNCQNTVGNDMALYNGNLGNNMSGPLRTECINQEQADEGGAFGQFPVLVYNRIIGGDKINISGYAIYKIYCSDITSSSAPGTWVASYPDEPQDEEVPKSKSVLTPVLIE